MWLKRPSTVVVTVAMFLVAMLTLGLFDISTEKRILQLNCHDSIMSVPGRLTSAKCEANQTLTYMRDLGGERYVVCRCFKSQHIVENDDEDETPHFPGVYLVQPDADSDAEPYQKASDKPEGTSL